MHAREEELARYLRNWKRRHPVAASRPTNEWKTLDPAGWAELVGEYKRIYPDEYQRALKEGREEGRQAEHERILGIQALVGPASVKAVCIDEGCSVSEAALRLARARPNFAHLAGLSGGPGPCLDT